jgi:hypothetical protein
MDNKSPEFRPFGVEAARSWLWAKAQASPVLPTKMPGRPSP